MAITTVVIQKVYNRASDYAVFGTVAGTLMFVMIDLALTQNLTAAEGQQLAAVELMNRGQACTEITAVEGTVNL